jgi:hypothetical protein
MKAMDDSIIHRSRPEEHREYRAASIGNAVGRLLYEIAHPGPAGLKQHPGDGRDILRSGMRRILSHPSIPPGGETKAIEAVEAVYSRAEKLCESPIERNLLAALVTAVWPFSRSVVPLIHNAANRDEPFPPGDVVIIPQFAILRYRLDFGVIIQKAGVKRIVGLECDGKDYHDAENDRFRDQYLAAALDIPVLRFRGVDLYREPITIADSIVMAIDAWRAS